MDHWKPRLRSLHRPPKGGGWTLKSLPPEITDEKIIWGWANRKRRQGGDHHAAVDEMMTYLRMQNFTVTPEVRAAIRAHADRQWCEQEPDRCQQKPSAVQAKAAVFHQRAVNQQASPPASCCGGGRRYR